MPRAHSTDDVDADPRAGRRVLVQPRRRPRSAASTLPSTSKPGLGLLLDRLEGVEEPVAQHPELQPVEDLVHLVAVPDLAGQLGHSTSSGTSLTSSVEPAVAQHAVEVLAQRLAGLALDLVDVRRRRRSRSPNWLIHLVAVFGPDAGHAGQVVAGDSPTQRGEVGVLRSGGRPYFVLHRLGRHARQVGDALARVEHGDVGRETSCSASRSPVQISTSMPSRSACAVTVAMHVVGLVALGLERRDAQRVEDLLDQGDLALEVGRARVAVGLVLGVLARCGRSCGETSKATATWVGLLVAQHVDQHRGEAVDRVGRLPGRGGEVLDRQGEERAVGQRVTVEQERVGVTRGSWSAAVTRPSLVRDADSASRCAAYDRRMTTPAPRHPRPGNAMARAR